MLLFILNIGVGAVTIPLHAIIDSILGKAIKSSWETILWSYRLPKAITAVLVGVGLSVSGLLMQTLFRNPMAGPYVLGLTSGSSLGVACVIMGSAFLPSFLISDFGIVAASSIGGLLVLLLVLLVSQRLIDTMAILVVGLMFGSFSNAFVSVLTYFSTAEELKRFTFWSMGSLSNLSWDALWILSACSLVGLLLSLLCVKSLDALLLGENYAKSLGVNYGKFKVVILIATSLLTGSVTAFVGPIAFIGLAVPHLARMVFQTSNHLVLFFGTLLLGAILLLFCDTVAILPGTNYVLPINAVTSMVGAPVVVWLLLRKRNVIF